jgi:thioredoxin reductase
MNRTTLPVAVIGAGPVGLTAAAHLISKGETPVIFEAGAAVGANVMQWGHVRLFSPWRYNVDAVAGAMLEAAGWSTPPADDFPTGRELVEHYLAPLAALPQIQRHLRLNTRVSSVTRQGYDKMKTDGREHAPFVLRIETTDGSEEEVHAKAVIDASGAYGSPSPLGASGVPALGERSLAGHIFYGIPDVLGAHRARYASRRVLVVGSGHSAFNALLDLAELAAEAPGTTITWVVRRSEAGQMYGGGARDLLPARGSLGVAIRELVESGAVRLVTGFKTTKLTGTAGGIVVAGEQTTLPPVDEIIATTGFRPDLSILGELRLAIDPSVESPVALAPLIDPNVHSCGTVPPHGAEELAHPEPGLYVVGMKSYGRAPTFLMLTGYEQVRSVVCAITGDTAGARLVELVLPETGVCSTDRQASAAAACCAPTSRSEVVLVDSAACCGVTAPSVPAVAGTAVRGGCCD